MRRRKSLSILPALLFSVNDGVAVAEHTGWDRGFAPALPTTCLPASLPAFAFYLAACLPSCSLPHLPSIPPATMRRQAISLGPSFYLQFTAIFPFLGLGLSPLHYFAFYACIQTGFFCRDSVAACLPYHLPFFPSFLVLLWFPPCWTCGLPYYSLTQLPHHLPHATCLPPF